MDKELDSKKVEDHRPYTRREETRSASRHQHHSPRNLVARPNTYTIAQISPSMSPIKKHMRRIGLDELQGDMKNIKPPTFYGEHKKYEEEKSWLLGMRKYFQLHN
jgi:hypothetical protein